MKHYPWPSLDGACTARTPCREPGGSGTDARRLRLRCRQPLAYWQHASRKGTATSRIRARVSPPIVAFFAGRLDWRRHAGRRVSDATTINGLHAEPHPGFALSAREHHPNLRDLIVRGPGRFVTYRSYLLQGRRVVWLARYNRKGLLPVHAGDGTLPIWLRPSFNSWIGALFALGSLLFMLGAGLSLFPNPLSQVQIAVVFFLGSIPFTTAGFLQNFQAANAPTFSPTGPRHVQQVRLLGWQPRSLGWLSTITQFAGTIAFNFNTFDAIHPLGLWYQQDLTIWLPGLLGSILFLVSGYLAFMETSHGYWSWKPRSLSWQIVFINLVGCVLFMTAGVLAFIPRAPEPGWLADLANAHLGFGAFCFLVGGLLLIRESRQVPESDAEPV